MQKAPDHPVVAAPSLDRRSLREVAGTAAREAEIGLIRRALQSTGGNKAAAAKLLRTDYKTLHLKVRRYGIREAESGKG